MERSPDTARPAAARLVGLLVCVGLFPFPARAQQPTSADDPAGIEFFEKKIRPLLAERCYGCHSAQAGKLRGGLHLDSREGILKGGNSGPAIMPADPERSLLIKAVR